METLFELTFQDQTLNPQVGTFTDASQATGTFTLEDGEYYLTNGDTKGFYTYKPIALQSGLVDDSKVIIEFDLKVVTASSNTHTIIGTYTGVDGSGIPTGAKITLQYNAGDIELVLGGGATATLIESADVVVDQWYHFCIDCYLAAPLASTYQVKIDGVSVTIVTGAATDYELGVISVLGTDQHACDECGIKNITLVTETNMYVGRTALEQALQDVKGYVDSHCVNLTDSQTVGGNKDFTGTTNIQSLTINGVACGDILTHNASEFVDVSSNQTIAGTKTFSSNVIIQGGKKVTCNLDNSFIELDGGTTWGKGGSIVLSGQDRSSYTNSVLIVSKSDTNTDILQYQNGELKPHPNNTNNSSLGTSTNKWESVYSNTYYLGNTAFGNIVTHNASEFVQVSDLATDTDMAEMAETWSI